MRRWTLWRKRPSADDLAGTAAPSTTPSTANSRHTASAAHLWGFVEALPALLAWVMPSGAVVMAFVGQLLLALLLITLSAGLWLRLWRGRRRRQRRT